MRDFQILATLLLLAIPLPASAQGVPEIAEPFKVGTFEVDGTPTVSLVLRDQLIVEVAAANTALQRDPYYARVQAPGGHAGADRALRVWAQAPPLRARQPPGRKRHAGRGPPLVRARSRGRAHPPADPVPGQDPERRGQLLQPRQRDRHRGGAGRGAAPAPGEPGRALPLPQAEQGRRDRGRRRGGASLRARPHRLGGRAGRGHRPIRQVRFRERRRGLRVRLPGVARHLRPRRASRRAATP